MLASLRGGEDPAALLFDLDGTLLDSAPDLATAVDRMLVALGYAAAGERWVRSWVGNGARVLVCRALAHVQHLPESDVDERQLDQALQLFMDCYEACCCELSRLYDGVIEALMHWQRRGIAMACVTNKPGRFTEPLLAHYGLLRFMPVAVSGDSLPMKKPAPEPLLHACELMSVRPSSAVMVGDSVNDVLAARAAGMPVACVDYGYNHGEPIATAGPDSVISSLIELGHL
jgi:phosphoglycolate phosphatase